MTARAVQEKGKRQAVARMPVRRSLVKVHRWLGLAAALFWLVQALTGLMLSFHFEIEDAALSTTNVPTDPIAIEQRIAELDSAGGRSQVNWIWTTAGLPDRYVVNFVDSDGEARLARIDGAGTILRDRPADSHSFLTMMRAIHIDLMAGNLGYWISGIAGALLATNIIFGLVVAWPRRGSWRQALVPLRRGGKSARIYSWHRAVGLWAAIPALLIALTGTFIIFEHEIGDALDVHDISLPANPPSGEAVGFARAYLTAEDSIPGSRFVGSTMPSPQDASYYAWVRAPGELYRGGYGGSLVIIDANDGSVRGTWNANEYGAARYLLYSFYPLHTGEVAGLIGRILAMTIGLWLAVTVILGLLLWWRKRPGPGRGPTAAPAANKS